MTLCWKGHAHLVLRVLVVAVLLIAAGAPASAQDEPPPEDEPPAESAVEIIRLAGDDRFATAAAIATATFPGGATSALLARADAFPDALAGTYLAGVAGAPLLLTASDALNEVSLSTMQTMGVQTVHLLGGTGAISKAVADALEAEGFTVNRIAGDDRYETAALIAATGEADRPRLVDGKRAAMVANGETFADALAAGSAAYQARLPLLLTPADRLAAATGDGLQALGIEHVIVLGGSGAVSNAAVNAINDLGMTTERVAGASRTDTAAAVADWTLAEFGWNATNVVLARSDDFPDGLAGGTAAGVSFSPILLTPAQTLEPAVARWLNAAAGTISSITVLGGPVAVSEAVAAEAQTAAQTELSKETLIVTPEPAASELEAQRTCSVQTEPDTTLSLRLVGATAVSRDADDEASFPDKNPEDGLADDVAVAAEFVTVGGQSQPTGTRAVDRIASNGTVTFTIRGKAVDDGVVVAFSDSADGVADALDVDDVGGPVEAFGVGCATAFVPPQAVSGTYAGLIVETSDVEVNVFTAQVNGTSTTFFWKDADELISVGDFEALLSAGDEIDVNYNPGGTSTFTVVSDNVNTPGKPELSVVAAGTAADGDPEALDDVEISWSAPENGEGTTYRIRRLSLFVDDAGNCEQAFTDDPEVIVGTVDSSPHVELDVPNGCYVYQVTAISSTGVESGASAASDAVEVPLVIPVDDRRPTSLAAEITDAGATGVAGAGDVIRIAFSEEMRAPAPGDSITVRDSGLTSGALVHGANARFTLNASPETVGGTVRPTGTVLTIEIVSTLADRAGPDATVDLPATFTAHSGVADLAGNLWDIATSQDATL